MIISYHTPIFRPLRALTLSNPLQATLLRCAQAGISVYSPHSALDATAGGINDWLASLVPHPPGPLTMTKNAVVPIAEKDGRADVGAGRIVTIGGEGRGGVVSFEDCVQNVKDELELEYGASH